MCSYQYYTDLWSSAGKDLENVLPQERLLKKKGPFKDPEEAKWLIGHLYMSYVGIVNKLDECYDQLIHPQKREVLGRLLDCSVGRLLEIKQEITQLELDDYVFYDNILMELKLTPADVEIHVPQYYWRDREKEKAHRKELIKEVYEELKKDEFKNEYLKNVPDEDKERVWADYESKLETENKEKKKQEELQKKRMVMSTQPGPKVAEEKTDEDEKQTELRNAILLIQRHERARQGRVQMPMHKRKRMLRLTGIKEEQVPEETAEKACIVIQRVWRRYRTIVLADKNMKRQMELLGMIQPSWKDKTPLLQIEEALERRRKAQEKNREEYENSIEIIKEKMTKLYSAAMNEDITDEIRYWFEWFFLQTNYLPDYPDDTLVVPTGETYGIPKKISPAQLEKLFPAKKKKQIQMPIPKTKLGQLLLGLHPIGGSALVVADYWIGPKEFVIIQQELEKMKKAGKEAGGEAPKKLSKEEKAALKKKEKEDEKKRLLAEEAEGFRVHDSEFLAPLAKADNDYKEFWKNLEESDNYDQRFNKDLVKDEKCWELSMQVRQAVDEAMRIELEILKDALERDKNPKKKRKKPKPAKKKEKKQKGKKDPTADSTLDELFSELFKNGIIKEYSEVRLRDYIGERSYTSCEERRNLEDGFPATGDVRELIMQLCILPLGSYRVHQLSKNVIRSVCLLGPEGNGKELLSKVICTETAAVLFDLTPENTAGKYPGKEGLKRLQHLIEKVSRLLQPSVIFVDGAEKLYYKKVPKQEKQFEPKRLGGMLSKVVKGIKAEDQVLVVGVSSYPWLCPAAKIKKTFDKLIYVPEPQYGTYYMMWEKILMPYHSLPRDFDISCLAKISTGYSLSTLLGLVKKVLSPGRICEVGKRPYSQEELMDELCKIDPTPDKILQKNRDFYNKTDMRKKRLDSLVAMKAALEKAKKK